MTKRDQIETENMLRRLTETLAAHAAEKHPSALVANKAREHAESLRRISITLQTDPRGAALAARNAGWSPTGSHGKWVLAGDTNFSQGSYMPTDRACRYICEDHNLLGLRGRP